MTPVVEGIKAAFTSTAKEERTVDPVAKRTSALSLRFIEVKLCVVPT